MHVFDTFVHTTAILLNVGLLVLVKKATTLRYHDYGDVIRLSCASDIVLSIAFLLCQPVGNTLWRGL